MNLDSILNLARPAIRSLGAYRSARSLQTSGNIFLDANENPFGIFNRYPEPQPRALRFLLSELYQCSVEEIFIGRGVDEAIDTLVRTFCESGQDNILICPPTYGMYEVSAHIQGAGVRYAPLDKTNNFSIDLANLHRQIHPSVKLVFVCSPNNPTGNVVDNDTLAQLAEKLGNDALLVIDEAYIEFSSFPSFCRRLPEFPNVVVLRTLSKAWGLAGVRCGVALAHPKIIELLQKVRAPYPISTPALQAATDLLSSPRQSESLLQIAELVQLRKNLKENLENLTYVERVFDSHANFLLLKVKNAARLVSTCAARGIILRDRSQDLGLDNCVRITVGTVAENKAVVQVIEELGYVVG